MQRELDELDTPMEVEILGINGVGFDVLNESICDGRDIPWLQEQEDSLIWQPWEITYRDVVIVGPDNAPIASYNLTENDLGVQAKYDELMDLILQAAQAAVR